MRLNNLGMLLVERIAVRRGRAIILAGSGNAPQVARADAPERGPVAQQPRRARGIATGHTAKATILLQTSLRDPPRARSFRASTRPRVAITWPPLLDGRENFKRPKGSTARPSRSGSGLLTRDHPLDGQSYKNLGRVLEKARQICRGRTGLDDGSANFRGDHDCESATRARTASNSRSVDRRCCGLPHF